MNNLDTIPKKMQKDIIASFWAMLRELESRAEDGSPLDKHFVEGYYRQWNKMTDDDKVPRWMKPAK